MAPGPLNMNDVTVFQTSQAIAAYVDELDRGGKLIAERVAVVGFDHRENKELGLSSEKFGRIVKLVLESKVSLKTSFTSNNSPF